MLIDCGVLPASPSEHNRLTEVAEAVRKEVMDSENPKLDAVVITHEHADHVSAFDPKTETAKTLAKIPFDEVWVAWTEDPHDKLAQKLNGQLGLRAVAAAAVRPRLKAAAGMPESAFAARAGSSEGDIGEILSNLGIAENAYEELAAAAKSSNFRFATTIRAAMDYVKGRVPDKKLRKLLPGKPPHRVGKIPEDDVRVFVLGPPRKEDLDKSPRHGANADIFHLAEGDLTAKAKSFAAAAGVFLDEGGNADSSQPFASSTSLAQQCVSNELRALKESYKSADWRTIDNEWLLAGEEFAMQLDSATNNTSLVLAIELVKTGEVLLFPGDAQVENWETWRDLKWTVKDASGKRTKVTGEDLLRRTVFYKVGHHGSHNGTLDAHGVQLMPSRGLVAMCPVIHAVTRKRKGDWRQIPKKSLCEALEKKCGEGFLRMDAEEGTLGGRLEGRVQESPLWVDYYLV